jgi:potassium efflux system protein
MRKKPNYLHTRRFQPLKIAILLSALILGLLLMPAWAQSNQSAPVVVDGRAIFLLSNTDELTARQRAKFVNSELQEVVTLPEPPEIEIRERNQSPTIWINGRYLLTVTQGDTLPGRTPKEQANLWEEEITKVVTIAQQERSVEFIRNTSILSVVLTLMASALHRVLGFLWREARRRLTRLLMSNNLPDDEQSQTLNLLFNLSLVLARTALWVAVVLYISNLFPLTRRWSYDIANIIVTSLTAPIFSPGQNSYSITDLLILSGLFLGIFILAGMVTNLLRSRVLRATGINRGVEEAIGFVVKYTLLAIGTVILLQIWGLDLSSLAILASALGVGIGLGLQNIAKDFGSGVVILLERPIQIGDFIEVGKHTGTVERIGLRSTIIRTLDDISIIVPNSNFLETEVINWNHQNPVSRLRLPVGVAYHSDVNVVKLALLEAAANHRDIVSTPEPRVFFKGFGDSALNFELLVWITKPRQHVAITSDLYFNIEASFRRHKVEIPFPQRDLHMRSGDLPIKLSPELEQALLRLSQDVNGRSVNKDNFKM